MDLQMPVMDGPESARRIRALDRPDAKTVPIVALTANASEEDRKESMAAGMNDHLEKPADSDELYAVLRKYIADNIEHREGEQSR
jgi:CheY-like chemotaxis protein